MTTFYTEMGGSERLAPRRGSKRRLTEMELVRVVAPMIFVSLVKHEQLLIRDIADDLKYDVNALTRILGDGMRGNGARLWCVGIGWERRRIQAVWENAKRIARYLTVDGEQEVRKQLAGWSKADIIAAVSSLPKATYHDRKSTIESYYSDGNDPGDKESLLAKELFGSDIEFDCGEFVPSARKGPRSYSDKMARRLRTGKPAKTTPKAKTTTTAKKSRAKE